MICKFKIACGGQFHTSGYIYFQGIERIDMGPEYHSLFEKDGEYYDEAGNEVGLTVEEAESGIGRIDLDGDHNTIYTTTADELTYRELEAVVRAKDFESEAVLEYLTEENNCSVEDLLGRVY